MAPTAIHATNEPSVILHANNATSTGYSNATKVPSEAPGRLDASMIDIILNNAPKKVPEPQSAQVWAQNVCTDHMITCKWTLARGWHRPSLEPYGPLTLMPTASVLQYATECFEGLKLYRGFDGCLRLFRPCRNAQRMLQSAQRISLPSFDTDELQKLIEKLCAVDGPKWLPATRPGHFLYLRPTMIGTADNLGIQKPKEALLYIIACCFPAFDQPYVASPSNSLPASKGPSPDGSLKLLASREDTVRAWPGGFGYAKLGSNYGPSLGAQAEAKAQGFDQVLWLLGDDRLVTEAGASNFFVVWRTAHGGGLQLVTAPLDDRVILDGITRRSVLQLAQHRLAPTAGTDGPAGTDGQGPAGGRDGLEPVEVVEKRFTIRDIESALREGRLVEAFVAGTAFFIAPVSLIRVGTTDMTIPRDKGTTGAYTAAFKTWLWNIMYGKEEHEWGRVIDEEGVAL